MDNSGTITIVFLTLNKNYHKIKSLPPPTFSALFFPAHVISFSLVLFFSYLKLPSYPGGGPYFPEEETRFGLFAIAEPRQLDFINL